MTIYNAIQKLDNPAVYQDFLDSHFLKEITTELLNKKYNISKQYIRHCKAFVRGKENLSYSHESIPQPNSKPIFDRFMLEINNLINNNQKIVVNRIALAIKTDHETVRSCLCYYAGTQNNIELIKFRK
ncbi:MAG: hypothetical protein LW595_06470 [Rickettsiales bacterium]|nr:hypothetical protein [Rickettsiales bacterium]